MSTYTLTYSHTGVRSLARVVDGGDGMRILVIGGAGKVGGLVLPYLGQEFNLRVYDLRPPASPEWEYMEGSVLDEEALESAAQGCDGLLYMAMGRLLQDRRGFSVPDAYDINVKGVHFALAAAARAGIRHVVYTSSLSVFQNTLDITSGATDREETLPEPTSVYALTKWMGEEVCRFFHRTRQLPIVVLRLFSPVSQEQWHRHRPAHGVYCSTSAPDVARAYAAALRLEHQGLEIIHITGDTTGRAYRHEKARRVLGWEPLEK